MSSNKVRLDPITGSFNLRVFNEDAKIAVPLVEGMREPVLIASIVISGESATASATLGEIPKNAWHDFDAEMRRHGVKTVLWERHKRGKTITKKRIIK